MNRFPAPDSFRGFSDCTFLDISNSRQRHQGFTTNRTTNDTYKYILPVINSADLTLPAVGYFSTVKSGGRSYSGNSHSAPHSGGYDKAVLNENTRYQAVLTGGSRTDNKNNVFCFITINGKRADTVRKSDLPDDMKSLPAEKLKGRIICVVCTGKKGNYYRYRVEK